MRLVACRCPYRSSSYLDKSQTLAAHNCVALLHAVLPRRLIGGGNPSFASLVAPSLKCESHWRVSVLNDPDVTVWLCLCGCACAAVRYSALVPSRTFAGKRGVIDLSTIVYQSFGSLSRRARSVLSVTTTMPVGSLDTLLKSGFPTRKQWQCYSRAVLELCTEVYRRFESIEQALECRSLIAVVEGRRSEAKAPLDAERDRYGTLCAWRPNVVVAVVAAADAVFPPLSAGRAARGKLQQDGTSVSVFRQTEDIKAALYKFFLTKLGESRVRRATTESDFAVARSLSAMAAPVPSPSPSAAAVDDHDVDFVIARDADLLLSLLSLRVIENTEGMQPAWRGA